MSDTIKLKFEIPQGYYLQEELNNYIKNSISKLLNNSSVEAYADGNIIILVSMFDIPFKEIFLLKIFSIIYYRK